MEGDNEGLIQILPLAKKITAVRRTDGVISHYFVSGLGWLTKRRVMPLVKAGQIDAVLVGGAEAKKHVRTRPDSAAKNNLSEMPG